MSTASGEPTNKFSWVKRINAMAKAEKKKLEMLEKSKPDSGKPKKGEDK